MSFDMNKELLMNIIFTFVTRNDFFGTCEKLKPRDACGLFVFFAAVVDLITVMC